MPADNSIFQGKVLRSIGSGRSRRLWREARHRITVPAVDPAYRGRAHSGLWSETEWSGLRAEVPREEGFAIARMTLPRGRWAHLGGSLGAVGYSARTTRMKSGQTSGSRLARPQIGRSCASSMLMPEALRG